MCHIFIYSKFVLYLYKNQAVFFSISLKFVFSILYYWLYYNVVVLPSIKV